jgi:hypothetical protein
MRNRSNNLTLFCAVVAVALTGLAAPAFAQETTPTPPPTETTPVTHHRAAGGNATGLGLGATAFLGGLGAQGPEVTYDFGMFHLGGLLAFDRRDRGPMGASETALLFGVSGWYHLHMGASSDFSLGAGLAYAHDTAGNGASAISLEPGAMVRAFVTPNVAVHARMGVVFAFDNAQPIAEHLALTAQIFSGFGFTYFFGG